MARCSLFVLATGVIHAWRAGKSKWFVETAGDSVRFRFREPNRRPKSLPNTIQLGGNKTGKLERDFGVRLNCKPVTLVRCREIRGEIRFSGRVGGKWLWEMTSACIIRELRGERALRLFSGKSSFPPPNQLALKPPNPFQDSGFFYLVSSLAGEAYFCGKNDDRRPRKVLTEKKSPKDKIMLLNDIVKQNEEKSGIDWDAYCRWRYRQCGEVWEGEKPAPNVWKCSCGAVNTSVAGEKYGRCRQCGLVLLSFLK